MIKLAPMRIGISRPNSAGHQWGYVYVEGWLTPIWQVIALPMTYGRVFTVTRQAIISDDFGTQHIELARRMGAQMAARTDAMVLDVLTRK